MLRTSERFLWVLAAAEVSFGRALRAPWPSNASWQRSQLIGNTSNSSSSSSSGGVGAEKSASAAASSNIPWTLVVRQLNVSALKLNLNYTKGVGTPKAPAAASSSKPKPSDDRFGGSMLDQASSIVSSASFASVASDGEGSFGNSSRHTSINAAALTSSAAGGGGGSGTAQHNRRRHNQSPQYPESTLGFALRALRVSLSNATVELREFALERAGGPHGPPLRDAAQAMDVYLAYGCFPLVWIRLFSKPKQPGSSALDRSRCFEERHGTPDPKIIRRASVLLLRGCVL